MPAERPSRPCVPGCAAAEREARVRQFQTSHTIPIFLLTSQVGGLGLTLTAADRVIMCVCCRGGLEECGSGDCTLAGGGALPVLAAA